MNNLIDKIELKSEIDSIHAIENFIESICEEVCLSHNLYGNILIAVTEAFNNALNHGNKNNPNKKIIIEFEVSQDFVAISVADQGNGFDYSNIIDPTAPENLLKETGRGIFIMKSLADNVEFSDNGSKVKLTFNLRKGE